MLFFKVVPQCYFNTVLVTNNLEINEKLVIIDYVLYIEEEKTGNFNIKINIKE